MLACTKSKPRTALKGSLETLSSVIIADNHTLVIEGLSQSLKKYNKQLCITPATSEKQLRELIRHHENIELIVLELNLADARRFAMLDFIREQMLSTPVVVLSASKDVIDMRIAINKGAKAYLTKTEPLEVILSAIQLVLAGGVYMPPILIQKNQANAKQCIDNRRANLTRRQKEVLMLLTEGLSNKEIGRELYLSEATVKAHVSAILKTLAVDNRTQAVNAAQKLSLALH